MQLYFKYIDSPVGQLQLVAHDQALVAIKWDTEDPKRLRLANLIEHQTHSILLKVEQQLDEYFRSQRQVFDVPLDLAGTEFQQKVWRALQDIPYGQTRSYKEIAEQIGNVKAVRAVGAANGKNPISIIVPCHRVIGASGQLVGFAGGLDYKQSLLQLENTK
ncbi:methylated-DNA--[protein]-cysteine S-methyltransferase [Acinetobacter rudis]|uniref:Methylated-DNA--protein-cysteine methyltransferase n=1 Tax=Acinetobacter rudis TaxID=632955 RepID=A0AAW8J9J8_9GAMM|nr:methylated-DNA--[protein]-cysteine S-methyltransferase [Acinetobacter rudis]MDQ8936440.1 methylated-DNA--[protein]-cysteine S-methyltransferase [Acinetobacter rudis]MDQ8953912.1 methylated-DNA--[protein]-cysteine S-methyltransferase [Acinetobacter rudis]MDQ9018696.1 methylated-DNA--[protein]-cysteine S-methyltransferase [Acinetobacter rudis]